MGQFKLEIVAVGGHGCQREVKDGGDVIGCGRQGCPDCEAAVLISDFARKTGANIERATLTHWPGTTGEVVDEFRVPPNPHQSRVSRIRHGSF